MSLRGVNSINWSNYDMQKKRLENDETIKDLENYYECCDNKYKPKSIFYNKIYKGVTFGLRIQFLKHS